MRKNRIVLIEWDDISVAHGWVCDADVGQADIAHCKSVGFLVAEDDKKAILVMAVSDLENIFERLIIPKGCIRSVKELRVK